MFSSILNYHLDLWTPMYYILQSKDCRKGQRSGHNRSPICDKFISTHHQRYLASLPLLRNITDLKTKKAYFTNIIP